MRQRRGLRYLGLLAVLCAPLGARQDPSQTASPETRALLVEGSQALQRGENAAAAEAFRKALAASPDSVEIMNDLAIALGREGKGQESIAMYQRALKLKPGDLVTSANLGIAYFRSQQYAPALPFLQKLAQVRPSFQSYELTGLTLFALDRFAEAAHYLEQASRLQPSDMTTLDMLGKAYLKSRNYQGAVDVFTRVMAVNPNSAEAHMLMGMAYDKLQREAEAEREYQAAAKASPAFMGVHSGLGLIYLREGKSDLAENEFRAELTHYPNDPVSNCMLGEILQKKNQPEQAIPYLQKAIAANPNYKDALFNLGKSEMMLDRPTEAIGPLRKAVAIDPDYYEAHYVLGTALRKTGRTAAATHELQIAEQIQARERAGLIKKVSKPENEQ